MAQNPAKSTFWARIWPQESKSDDDSGPRGERIVAFGGSGKPSLPPIPCQQKGRRALRRRPFVATAGSR
jgi:hypothetical protein